MGLAGAGSTGGYVDETVEGNQFTKPYSMSIFVFNAGSTANTYKGVVGLSQPNAPGGPTNSTLMGLLLPGTGLIRLGDDSADGTVALDTDVPTSSLSAAQLSGWMHWFACFANSNRRLYIDGALVVNDTRTMTAQQRCVTFGINYGLDPAVQTAMATLYSGFGGPADVSASRAGYDGRDVARQSSGRLRAMRQFPLASDLTESFGLFTGFRNNSSNQNGRVLELDDSVAGTFHPGNNPTTVPWSGQGGVALAATVASSHSL